MFPGRTPTGTAPVAALSLDPATGDSLSGPTLVISPPVLGAAPLSQRHRLSAEALDMPSLVQGAASLSQEHRLSGPVFDVSAPVLASAVATVRFQLAANGLLAAQPTLGEAFLPQRYVFSAKTLVLDLVLEAPALAAWTPQKTVLPARSWRGLVMKADADFTKESTRPVAYEFSNGIKKRGR